MTSALRTLHSKGYVIIIPPFLDTSSTEYKIIKGEFKWKPGKKPLNSIKETRKDNQGPIKIF